MRLAEAGLANRVPVQAHGENRNRWEASEGKLDRIADAIEQRHYPEARREFLEQLERERVSVDT